MTLETRCTALVEELGLGCAQDIRSITPLTGGVASDIAKVEMTDRALCAKFALPKLKVQADWYAPVHRNAAEYAWLNVASQVSQDQSVQLFGRSEKLHGFAMEFLSGPDVYLWKDALMAEAPARREASTLGDTLGRIHATSTQLDFDPSPFHNQDDFRALRIEPYLSHTARSYPDLAAPIAVLETSLYETRRVLVHGDVSPKNILFRDGGPVILDAECATMGDAAFDPAFCLNHLILKALHLPRSRQSLLDSTLNLWDAYAPHVQWEDPAHTEARVCGLLPALMLARVDGKSPVEYLEPSAQGWIRETTPDLIMTPYQTLPDLIDTLRKALT